MAKSLRDAMEKRHNIRNISVIAHIGHGKSTLCDSFVADAGLIARERAGEVRYTDTRADEADRGFSIKSTAVSVCFSFPDESLKNYKGEREGNTYLINLIDTPGHTDFSAEVTASVSICDGALVVVDYNEGVSVQTRTVIRQAICEGVIPVLSINKLDRLFLDPKADGEMAYGKLRRVIEDTNNFLSTCQECVLGDVRVYPERGNVSFASGLQGWAFTLKTFARMYSSKFGVDESKMMCRLWGDNYFDPCTKKWTNTRTKSPSCVRGFVQFCYKPIKEVTDSCLKDDKEKLTHLLKKLEVKLSADELCLTGKSLIKCVMTKWICASLALGEMVIYHLPSPVTAQNYKVQKMYSGPLDDMYANAIRNCDPEGPLMLYVTKMVMVPDKKFGKGRFFAFGRVFSGKVETGKSVKIIGPNNVFGENRKKTVLGTGIWLAKQVEKVNDVPCGNMVVLLGIDKLVMKCATLTGGDDVEAHPFRALKFIVSPVVSVAVRCRDSSEIPKLHEGLKRLEMSDPIVICENDKQSGESIILGAGDMHLEVCLKDLADFTGGVDIIKSQPLVSYRESVSAMSHVVTCKSENRFNSVSVRASFLCGGVLKAIDEGRVGPSTDRRVRAKILKNEFGWEKKPANNIWSFGPEGVGPNIMTDNSNGPEGLQDIKEYVVNGFEQASKEGPLASEKMRGVKIEVCDANVHIEKCKRLPKEIETMTKNAVYASFLSAQPRLQEPLYQLEIRVPINEINGVYIAIKQSRGRVSTCELTPDGSFYHIFGHMPVADYFGFPAQLMSLTSGEASVQNTLVKWVPINAEDPLEKDTLAAHEVSQIRKRKGMNLQVPPVSEFENG